MFESLDMTRGLKLNQHWLKTYEPTFIQFQTSRMKIGGVSLICETAYFLLHDPFWAYSLTLSGYNFETEGQSPKPNKFSESWVRKDSVGTSPKKFPCWKFSGTERFTKKFHFSLISLAAYKNKVSGSCTHNFDATDLPNS